ncbi:MAG: hypothetical protein LBT93_07335 [Treponema sp.]|jgi:hypothetical protein|nr:hypothetical protein [Treponema sp.]
MKNKLALFFCILLFFGLIGCDTGNGEGVGSTGDNTVSQDLYGTAWDYYSPGFYYLACFGIGEEEPAYGDKVMQLTTFQIEDDEYDGTYWWYYYSINGDIITLDDGSIIKTAGSKAEYTSSLGRKLEFMQIKNFSVPDNLVGIWENVYNDERLEFTKDGTVTSTSRWGVFNTYRGNASCTVKTIGDDNILLLFPDFDDLGTTSNHGRAFYIDSPDEDTLVIRRNNGDKYERIK